MSSSRREHEKTGSESARARRHAGSGARGRQGATVERDPTRRRARVATGTASTERDFGRSKTEREGRENREGTG
ncbi:MAG: hypothetical protein FWJ93_13780 [Micromonosporaceae bacterium]